MTHYLKYPTQQTTPPRPPWETLPTILKYPTQQTTPPRPPWETLPTMYDLPSENTGESGLPDEFHDLQPQLLSATLRLTNYATDQVFTTSDMNLYYDVHHQLWYKRPDWFLVIGVPRLYGGRDLRLSYVTWQEGISPFVVVELLSPGTEKEDLGMLSDHQEAGEIGDRPPPKWQVYEQILRVPYYIVFDRYTEQFRAFNLVRGHYEELEMSRSRLWIPDLQLGLGLWEGIYQGCERFWLRWFNADDEWIPTPEERALTAEAALRQEQQRTERLAEKLKSLGIDPEID